VLVVVAVVAVVAAVVAFILWRPGNGAQTAAPAWTTVTAEDATDATDAATPETGSTTRGADETVTVTADRADRADRGEPGERSTDGSAADGDGPSGGSTAGEHAGTVMPCDGRGVLIVSSVMGDSPSFRSEVDGAVSANPGAVLLDPGHCPSLRATVDGITVHPVVVDYGDDRAALCRAAASTPGSNARLLDDDTSYSSPC
jgi:hypothetical protein